MKKIILLIACSLIIVSCKETKETENNTDQELKVTSRTYPENVSKVFNAHGGIDKWNAFEGMYYEIEKEAANDIYDIALKSRKSLIRMAHHKLGYDGENVWLKNLDTVTYKSNPKFYYNLIFYFYAMPFVFGDDGINFKEAPVLNFEGKTYPGILISYDSGIGESPEDEYILYYNPDTYQMEWLGYTVTYFSKEKGKEFHFIKYSAWQEIDGVKLPKTLSWYNYENGVPTTKRNDMQFVNVKLSDVSPIDDMFKVPDSIMIIK